MTPHEQQLLTQFLQRVNAAQGIAQDSDAHALIQQHLANQPDATYLLVQRAMLLELALEESRQQIALLEHKLQRQHPGNSFLSHGLETVATPSTKASSAQKPDQHPSASNDNSHWLERVLEEVTDTPIPSKTPSDTAPVSKKSWFSTAVTTAAEVAGGLFLWYGMDHLLDDDDKTPDTSEAGGNKAPHASATDAAAPSPKTKP